MAENIRIGDFIYEIQNRMNVEIIKENNLTPKQYGMSLKRRRKKK